MLAQHIEPCTERSFMLSRQETMDCQRMAQVEVVWFTLRALFECSYIRMCDEDIPELEQRGEPFGAGVIRLRASQPLERLTRRFDIAVFQAQFGKLSLRIDVARFSREDLLERRTCSCPITGGFQSERSVQRAFGRLRYMPVEQREIGRASCRERAKIAEHGVSLVPTGG